MKLTSKAFAQGKPIPKKHSCEGENISPPLKIENLPSETKSIAIIVDDPDAPMGTFDHWIAWNITPSATIEEDCQPPMQGNNDFGNQKYGGPYPPPGKAHRYFFRVYALDDMLDLPKGSSKEDLQDAMESHIIDESELMGTYQR